MLRISARSLRQIVPKRNYISFFSSLASPPPALSKVLVANRGEIACRVLRTCQRLGIPTVALYSVADGPDCLHARSADESYLIGTGPAPADSYLLQEQVLEIAQHSGAQAIHPGYGFLSENAIFCQAVQDAGISFIGPPASAITAMGSKSQSKAIMEAAQVPTTPGFYDDEQQEADFLLQKAKDIGFPILIKAVMGGGGKGMRLVWKEAEFKDALQACQRESQAAFGDSKVLLEKYLVKPRHVEVQVIADTHGNVVHLFERDCSLQRRHQKIIEEAPASDLDNSIRERLGEMGKRAAQAVGYFNAGTVEFLLDTQDPEQFYFCEMNTRLQVEHPITEQITGVDLVEWQLRIAAGEELPKSQSEIHCCGHALEARIYAENPARNFLPATGQVWHHSPPATINSGASAEGIRVDTGIQPGQEIGVYYDPMISKLIVHDEDRTKALKKLVSALRQYQIAGVPTNIDFLIKCAEHPTFGKAGAVNTGFLDDHAADVHIEEDAVPPPMAQAVGTFAGLLHLENRFGSTPNNKGGSPWSSLQGSWRIGGKEGRARRILPIEDGEGIECLSCRDGSFDIRTMAADGREEWFHVNGSLSSDSSMEVVVNGTQRIKLTTILKEEDGVIRVRMWPEKQTEHFWHIDLENPMSPVASLEAVAGSSEGMVKAPMPGKISRVNFEVGDAVKRGDVVMVMEAMKMEHAIKAPIDGILSTLHFKTNDVVNDGAILMLVESGEDNDGDSNAA